jgi:hypothetical protein
MVAADLQFQTVDWLPSLLAWQEFRPGRRKLILNEDVDIEKENHDITTRSVGYNQPFPPFSGIKFRRPI